MITVTNFVNILNTAAHVDRTFFSLLADPSRDLTELQAQAISVAGRHAKCQDLVKRMQTCREGRCNCGSGACWYGERSAVRGILYMQAMDIIAASSATVATMIVGRNALDIQSLRSAATAKLDQIERSGNFGMVMATGLILLDLSLNEHNRGKWRIAMQMLIGVDKGNEDQLHDALVQKPNRNVYTSRDSLWHRVSHSPFEDFQISNKYDVRVRGPHKDTYPHAEYFLDRTSGFQRMFCHNLDIADMLEDSLYAYSPDSWGGEWLLRP